jgi:hypothetical protein
VVGDGLEREGRHDVSPRLRRRREDLHEVAHRDLVRRQLQQRPPGAARGRRVPAAAAADPREQAHAPPPPGTEGFEIRSPSFFFSRLGDEASGGSEERVVKEVWGSGGWASHSRAFIFLWPASAAFELNEFCSQNCGLGVWSSGLGLSS